MSAPAALHCPLPSPQLTASLRCRLVDRRDALRARFLATGSDRQLLRTHAAAVDDVVKTAWQGCHFPRSAALVAVGGYGRGEMFPHSDVDLLVLLPESPAGEATARIEALVQMLWDIGLDPGISVRSRQECVDLAVQDLTVRTNLLEGRLLSGDRGLFRGLEEALRASLDPASFLAAKQMEQQQRHVRFHDTAYNLEPNLKESPGGLRDLQTVLWIANACGFGSTWSELARAGLITPSERDQVRRHESFLNRLRIHLHYLARRKEDRLLFDFQTQLAREFGLEDTSQRRSSERLMQRYYLAAKAVQGLNSVLLQNLRSRVLPASHAPFVPIDERFGTRGGLLEVRSDDTFERHPGAILESFLLLQKNPEIKDIAAPTLRALWRARRLIGPAFRRDPANRRTFMDILRAGRGVTRVLRRMNQYDLLGRYIPAFGRIVGRMQHDLFHVYTVDEHILMVLRNLRRFAVPEYAHEYPLCSRLLGTFQRPEVLYVAALFHDIAKGRGGDHSLLGRVDARRFCREHELPREDAELVEWLVANHLVMSATAQKQDLADPAVVAEFAARVRTERRLIALYLITVADIRGTSPKVWNAWKAKLLQDLFQATRRQLLGGAGSPDSHLQARQHEALELLRLHLVPEDAHHELWSQLDVVYFLRHEPQEIAWHTRLLNYRVSPPEPIVKARLSPIGEGLQVMIYAPDAPDLFARICGFFEQANYNIVEAKIHTTRHGYALDTFTVMETSGSGSQYRDLIAYIEFELQRQIAARAPLQPPARGRLSRHLRAFPIVPEIEIKPDERGTHHLLHVLAGDQPGLLYRIARCLLDQGVVVHSAKINTLGGRAEDAFLVSGGGLGDSRNAARLDTRLLEELRP